MVLLSASFEGLKRLLYQSTSTSLRPFPDQAICIALPSYRRKQGALCLSNCRCDCFRRQLSTLIDDGERYHVSLLPLLNIKTHIFNVPSLFKDVYAKSLFSASKSSYILYQIPSCAYYYAFEYWILPRRISAQNYLNFERILIKLKIQRKQDR